MSKKSFKIGVCGIGKLGFPVAVAMGLKGHDVMGYDINPNQMRITAGDKLRERDLNGKIGIKRLARQSKLRFGTLSEVVDHAEIIFIAVQTPHEREYEGITRTPKKTKDFDYTHLVSACRAVFSAIEVGGKKKTVAVISTVLPGTMQKHVIPMLNKYVDFVYNPSFIAMGSTIKDWTFPEFVLIGEHGKKAADTLEGFYKASVKAPVRRMSVPSAELCKVAYNSIISSKIVAANTIMDICEQGRRHGLDMDADEITDTLKLASRRLTSSAYMSGGLGDSGACMPPGQLVHVEDGVRAIEDVVAGDRVLGGDGLYHEVLEVYRRPYDGEVITLKGRGLSRFTVTGNHEVYVAKDLRAIFSNGRRNQADGPQLDEIELVRADAVTDGHYIIFPSLRLTNSTRDDWRPSRGRSGPAPKAINTECSAYIIVAGYYMAEGNVWCDRAKNGAPTRTSFSFNSATDSDYIAEIISALGEVAPASTPIVNRVNPRATCTEVRINNTLLAKQLIHDFGSGAEAKFIPSWILNDPSNAKLCLRALFRGDGSSHGQGFSFSTISPNLAHGVSLMLRRLGIASATHPHAKRTGADGVVHRPSYDIAVANAAYIEALAEIIGMPIRHGMQAKKYHNVVFERNGNWYHYINKIERSHYSGTVYNLNVADVHNYVSIGGLISNCHPRDLIAMSDLAANWYTSHDFFGSLIAARENQAERIARHIGDQADLTAASHIYFLGYSYKPESDLTFGSCALLIKNLLEEDLAAMDERPDIILWDPYVPDSVKPRRFKRGVYFIGMNHKVWKTFKFPRGSVVVDPWGMIADQHGVHVVRIGRR